MTGDSNGGLTALSAAEAIAGMKTGDLDAKTYAEALLERAREKQDLNAFLALDPDRVLAAARQADAQRARGDTTGALHGLPIPVKDSVFTEAYPTTGGTPALQSLDRRIDAPLITRLKSAGGYVMGKTNLHELSTGHTSNNEMFGAVRNPYDPARIPGGSSGGTGVAVATGMAPMGIGEDTFGSIRVPAALCGVAGFRPTTGPQRGSGAPGAGIRSTRPPGPACFRHHAVRQCYHWHNPSGSRPAAGCNTSRCAARLFL